MKQQRYNHLEMQLHKAMRNDGWYNWYLDRGHFYGSGAMLRKCMRQHSWRRKH